MFSSYRRSHSGGDTRAINEAYVTFTSINPQRLTATAPANESITWQRAG